MLIYQDLNDGQKNKARKLFLMTAFLISIFFFSLVFYYFGLGIQVWKAIKNETKFQITVTGEGRVFAKPDIAQITIGVKSQGSSLKEALRENSEKSNKVTFYLKSNGVEEKDIKTSYFNINPQYQYDDRPCPYVLGSSVSCPPRNPPKIVGYEIYNTYSVKVRKMDSVGDIIDGAVSAGANEVNGPSFVIDDDTKLKAEAEEEAISKAKEKAMKRAGDLGVRLGRIVAFSDSGYYPPVYGTYAAPMMEKGADSVAPAPSIETGENEIRVTVTITYEVR